MSEAKVDVYSYGIVLFEVILGQFPIEEKLLSMMQVIRIRWAFMHCLIVSCIQDALTNDQPCLMRAKSA